MNVWYLLNERERQLVRQLDLDYAHKFQQDPATNENLIYFLGDRYEFSRTWSAVSNSIPTYRTNTGKYLARSRMVLSTVDKLASLGWPVSHEAARELGTTVFPALDVKRADVLAGNSMHLTCASVVLLLGLCCFGKADQ